MKHFRRWSRLHKKLTTYSSKFKPFVQLNNSLTSQSSIKLSSLESYASIKFFVASSIILFVSWSEPFAFNIPCSYLAYIQHQRITYKDESFSSLLFSWKAWKTYWNCVFFFTAINPYVVYVGVYKNLKFFVKSKFLPIACLLKTHNTLRAVDLPACIIHYNLQLSNHNPHNGRFKIFIFKSSTKSMSHLIKYQKLRLKPYYT